MRKFCLVELFLSKTPKLEKMRVREMFGNKASTFHSGPYFPYY